MAQPSKENSQLADALGNPMIAGRGASVTAAAGATYSAPAVTASNPSAPTNDDAVTNMTDPVTKTEGEAVSAALSTLEDEVTAYEVDIGEIIVDNAATLVELDDLADDVALIRTGLNDLIGRLEAHGLLADN